LRRARVRLAQLEPVLDDARRDARLADRARRTAECERDRANALLETLREETREILRCADEQRLALCDAERDVAAARRATFEVEKARDEATKKLSLVVLETDELRTNARKHEETAQKHLRDLTRLRAELAFLSATQMTPKKDAGTNTAAFSDAFHDVLSERYKSGFCDGDASREKATREVLERERELAEAARDAAHARASDAEARVARLAASLERTREAAAAERKRAAAINATRDADAAASKKKALAAENALRAAETREAVFRARLEAMALALASRVRETDSRRSEPSNDDASRFGAKEVRVKSRVAPRARDAAFERKKRTGRASKPRKSSSALATRSRSQTSSPGRRVFAPAAPLRSSGDSSSGGRETNAPVRGGNRHDDWLPEVRPPPRMLA
jgi:chromosome segregation ATPase